MIFISNINISKSKGGWDGLGAKFFELLQLKHPEIKLLDNLSPKVNLFEKYLSVLMRKYFKVPGNFYFFSNNRLRRISKILNKFIHNKNEILFFHGSTPWCYYKPSGNYYILVDCCFYSYLQIYLEPNEFRAKDIDRILTAEGIFLNNAKAVLFTNHFALEATKSNYKLAGDNFQMIGQGPSIELPNFKKSNHRINKQFLFIATDFMGKGGQIIYDAFLKVLKAYPDFKLCIVGQEPPYDIISHPSVDFYGYVSKSEPEGLKKLILLYQESFAILLLSKKDILPLVIIEAGLSGCPAIASNFAGIPELIENEKTGFCIEADYQELVNAMMKLIEMPNISYFRMRELVQYFMAKKYSWTAFQDKTTEILND
jgi:glycosyltransferase involved in cell wall biosynthesis